MSRSNQEADERLKRLSASFVVPSVDQPDARAAATKVVKSERLSYADRKKEQALIHADRELAQRETFAKRIFVLVCLWVTAVYALLLCQGFRRRLGFEPFSDKLLIVLITSTTFDIIATLVGVLNYVFRLPANSKATVPRIRSRLKRSA